MRDLILDLQSNGGGMLRTAISMSDEFLSGNKLIVYTEAGRLSEKTRMPKRKACSKRDDSSCSLTKPLPARVRSFRGGARLGSGHDSGATKLRQASSKGPFACPMEAQSV